LDIFQRYKEIKERNIEALHDNIYIQFRKQSSSIQHRLISTYDTEKGGIHMEFFQAQVPQPKSATDFKKATFEFEAKDVDPLDQIGMHMQTGDMVYAPFTQTAIIASNMQLSLNNVES